MTTLIPIFENPRTRTVHTFKRLPNRFNQMVGVTVCGREEKVKSVPWTSADSVNCKSCLRSSPHIVHINALP